ncbi:MAG: phosphatidate cytidylyltransferase [Chthoniobacterales bacterium]
MSPSAALHDPIFRAYLVIVLGLLVLAGAVLLFLQLVFRMDLGSVWKTYRSWLWLAPLAAFSIFAGRFFFILGLTAVGLLAGREFLRVSQLATDRLMSGAVYLGIALVGVANLFGRGLASLPALVIALFLLVPIVRNRAEGQVRKISLGIIAFVICGWMWEHLGLLANSPNAYGYICFLVFATEVTDVAAFTCGKIFGRYPLRSEISARKTWEGALGALLVALTLPWLLRFSFPFFGPWQLVLTGLIVGIGGPVGDLALSVLKRDLRSKDWGAAIPGHGGVLDRIDSLIFVAPLFIFMTTYYYPGR